MMAVVGDNCTLLISKFIVFMCVMLYMVALELSQEVYLTHSSCLYLFSIVNRWVEFEIERDYPGNAHLTQA